MKYTYSTFLVLVCSLFITDSFSQQPGSIDPGFQVGTGANGLVATITAHPDGRILIGGGFNSYKGVPRRKIARLHPNGSIDYSFNPGTSFDGEDSLVLMIKLQNDSTILVGGSFSSYQGIAANNIVRLKANGDPDTSFQSGLGVNERVIDMAIQADGKIVIGGYFTSYNGVLSNGIARLNPDGTIDTSFHTGTGTGQGLHVGVHEIHIQNDHKLVITGRFDSYNSTPARYMARLNPDGTIDPSFTIGNNLSGGNIGSSAIQPDGKILIGGPFHHYAGAPAWGIARLNDNGSADTSFHSGYGVGAGSLPYHNVSQILLQQNGQFVIVGYFMTYDGVLRNNISRLNSNGSIDLTFAVGSGTNGYINAAFLQDDGKIIIGGQFTSYNGQNRARILRLNGGADFADLSETENNPVFIYPNPASASIHVHNIPGNSTIQLLELNGRLLKEFTFSSSGVIDTQSLPDGIYTLLVKEKNTVKSYHKLIVSH